MPEIKIMSIQDLLHIPHLKNSFDIAIIFITTKPNYYDFGHTSFVKLYILDGDGTDVQDWQIGNLLSFIERIKEVGTIYVCCDAGLSRSPAVAHFVAVTLGQYKQAEDMEQKYRFMNMNLYKKLMEK